MKKVRSIYNKIILHFFTVMLHIVNFYIHQFIVLSTLHIQYLCTVILFTVTLYLHENFYIHLFTVLHTIIIMSNIHIYLQYLFRV